MKKIWGYQNSTQQPQLFPVGNAPGLVNALPVGILAPDGSAIRSAGDFGLAPAIQTQSQIIENQAFNFSGSPTKVLANFTQGPGILTKFHFIATQSATSAASIRGLLFSFFVDGESIPSLQFDGDLFGASGLPASSPSISTPYVYECDHLVMLYAKDNAGDFDVEFIFKYPVPFASSLQITVQNQAADITNYAAIWSGADVQFGIFSPRRLKSAFTNYHAPSQIPSAPEWSSSFAYLTGNLATRAGVLYQASANNTNSQPPSANWTAVSTAANLNFNTGFPLLSVNQPLWIVHFSVNGSGPVNGGAYGSANANSLSFLESNIAVYDGNLTPGDSFPGVSPIPTYNSSGTEDFMGGSFYWLTTGDSFSKITVPTSVATTPFDVLQPGKTKQLRHGYVVSVASAFMNANVDLLSLCGGIRCGSSAFMRWEQGNLTRAQGSGPINYGNTWKINPTVLYYV